jgi:hypothetical protein
MDQNQLLSSAVEIGLDLLEKNGGFTPFCKAVNEAGETFIYTTESDTGDSPERAYESVLFNVKRDVASRGLRGAAFCIDVTVRLSDSEDRVPAVKVETHYIGSPAAIWYFLYKIEASKAIEYHTYAATENLFD